MAAELTIQSVEQMTQAVDKMSTAFKRLQSSIGTVKGTNALKELQSVVSGVNALNSTLATMDQGLTQALGKILGRLDDLPRDFADALNAGRRTVRAAGEALGSAAGEGMAAGAEQSAAKFKTTWAKQKNEFQKLYEDALKSKAVLNAEELRQMQLHGVQLSKVDRERLAETVATGKQMEVLDKEATAKVKAELRERLNAVRAGNALLAQEQKEAAQRNAAAQRVFAQVTQPLANKDRGETADAFVRELESRERAATQLQLQYLNQRINDAKAAAAKRLADEAAAGKEAQARLRAELRDQLNTLKAGNALLELERKESAARAARSNQVFAQVSSPLAGKSAADSANVFAGELASREKAATQLQLQYLNQRIQAAQEAEAKRLADAASAEKERIALAQRGAIAIDNILKAAWTRRAQEEEAAAQKSIALQERWMKALNNIQKSAYDKQAAEEAAAAQKSQALQERWALALNRIQKTAYDKQAAEAEKQRTLQNQIAKAQANQALGGTFTTGTYSVFAPNTAQHGAIKQYNDELSKTVRAGTAAGKSLQALGIDANTTHSAVRGLASGFNLLWLTWGNLAPLLAGAAISNGFVQTIKLGAQVSSTFDAIRVLSEESRASVNRLEQQMLSIAKTGPYGLNEIATAMKTLSLAGMSAAEVGSSIKDVLNFAVAGDTSIEKAADVLTTVATAFNYSSTEFSIIGDVIAKAAAVSKASVESMGEAFKTSSVLNKQYGASLEDVGLGLALVNNLGIQGSAAGTALRNMYVDLSGRTKQVAATMKALGINMLEANGKFPDMVTMIERVQKGLDGLKTESEKSQAKLQLFSERGSKPITEALDQLQKKAKEAGSTVPNELSRIRDEIANAAGFQGIAAAEMSLSATNQIKMVFTTLQASAYEAFKQVEPIILTVSKNLRDVFASDGFKQGLANMITMMAKFTEVLASNLDVVKNLALAYVSLKAANFVVGMLSAASAGIAAMQVQAAALTAGTVAASGAVTTFGGALGALATRAVASSGAIAGALGVFGRLLGVLTGPIGLAITGAATAWQLYAFFADKASRSNDQHIGSRSAALVEALEKEAAATWDKVEAMKAGITVSEYLAQKEAENAKLGARSNVDKLKSELQIAQDNLTKVQARIDSGTATKGDAARWEQIVKQRRAALTVAQADLRTQEVSVDLAKQRVIEANKELKALSDKQRAETAAEAASTAKYGNLSLPDDSEAKAARDNILRQVEARYRDEAAALKEAESRKQRMLEDLRRNELISEGEYYIRSVSLTVQSEQERLVALEKAGTAYKAAMDKVRAEVSTKMEGKQLQAELKNIQQAWETFQQSLKTDKSSIQEGAIERQQKAANKAAGEVNKLEREISDFWAKDAERINQQNTMKKLEADTASATEQQKAFAKAAAEASGEYTKHIPQLAQELARAEASLKDMDTALADAVTITPEQLATWDSLFTRIAILQAQIDKLRATGTTAGESAGEAAARAVEAKQLADFSGKLGDAVSTALFEGGKAGRKKLRDVVVEEMQKPITIVVKALLADILTNGGGNAMNLLGQLGNSMSGINQITSFGQALAKVGSSLAGSTLLGKAGGMLGNFGGGLSYGAGSYGVGGVSGAFNNVVGLWNSGAKTGAIGAGLGAIGSAVGALNLGRNIGQAISGGYSASGNSGNRLVNIGATIGSIFGPLTAGIGGAVGGLINRAFGRKAPEVQGRWLTGSLSSEGVSGLTLETDMKQKGGWFRSNKYWTDRSAAPSELTNALNETVNQTVEAVKKYSDVLGLFAGDINKYTEQLKIKVPEAPDLSGKSADEVAKLTEQYNSQLSDALNTAFNSWADRMVNSLRDPALGMVGKPISDFQRQGETLTETLVRLGSSLLSVNESFTLIGKNMNSLGSTLLVQADNASKLIDAFGSADTLRSALSSFQSNYYTQAEQAANNMTMLQTAFKQLNVTMPSSNAAFRQLVLAQDLTTESGRSTFTALMALQDAFAALYPVVEDLTKRSEADILSERKSLQEELNQLTMTQVQLLALQREALDESNRSLFDQIQAAKLANAVADERKGLQDQLNQLTLSEAQLLALQRDALYDSNKALFDQIQAAKAAKAAQEEAAKAAEAEANRLQKANQQKYDLETKLLELQGNTQAVRERELAALEPEARAMQLLVWAREEANKAAEEAAAAAEKLKDAWKSVADSILDEVNRIKGTMGGEGNYAKAQADFSIAAAAAQAGDVEAAKKLPELSKTLLDYAEKNASTTAEFAAVQGATLGTLERILRYIGSSQGVTIPGFASGGMHAGGLRLVGEDGAEVEATGPSRIYSNEQVSDMLGGSAIVVELQLQRQELERMAAELASLRQDVRAGDIAVATNTGKVAKLLEQAMPTRDAIAITTADGNPVPVKVIT